MTHKILFIDDEVNVLQGFRRRLRKNFVLDTASSGDEGLKLLQSNGPYAVVVSDMQMPGMSGLEFLAKVKDLDPDAIRIMLTGNADQKTTADAVNEGEIFRFLNKPCAHEILATAINAGIEEYQRNSAHKNRLEDALEDVRNLSERLSYYEIYDQLTNLINRQEFEKRIQKTLECTANRREKNTLFYLDLDQFKVVNDACGQVAGNELLKQITRLLKKHTRKTDTLARLGGDEFGILMERCSIDQAIQAAERIRKDLNGHLFKWDQKSFQVSASIGLVCLTEDAMNAEQSMSIAESTCYRAKDSGRDRVHVFRPDDENFAKHQREIKWVSQIYQALNENRFCLYFQPIAPISHNNPAKHYELLIRMKDLNGALIPPGAFLPTAELYNLSVKLDRWVISTAFRWLVNHPKHLDELHLCSINLSGLSLGNQEFLDFVIAEFGKTQVPAEKICFEITETAAITNLPNAINIIDRLKQLGCYFALDDFGSGLSSYAYLKNLRVDFLKIDGLFVKEIVDSKIDSVMVKSISEIGHAMGLQTVAEFVENKDILKKLKEIGVNYAQGYGIAMPRPIEELIKISPE